MIKYKLKLKEEFAGWKRPFQVGKEYVGIFAMDNSKTHEGWFVTNDNGNKEWCYSFRFVSVGYFDLDKILENLEWK